MTERTIYLASHSSLDIVSTLNHFERYRDRHSVVILVSGTTENLQFLQHAGVPASALRFLQFPSRAAGRKRSLLQRVRELRTEKRMMDDLVAEIGAAPDNELVFHSFDDPQLGYLAARLSATNPVTLVDVLEVQRGTLSLRDLLSLKGLKNLAQRELLNLIFGRLYQLRGTASHLLLEVDLRRIRLRRQPKSAGGTVQTLEKYRYRIPAGARTAFVLYADSFGVEEARHVAAYSEVLDCLTAAGWRVFIKIHPQSRRPEFFDRYPVEYVPKYVPFEFVELSGVSLVVGLWGASLLCGGNVPTVSILRMLYDPSSDHYRDAMLQLVQNTAIRFVGSSTELAMLMREIQ